MYLSEFSFLSEESWRLKHMYCKAVFQDSVEKSQWFGYNYSGSNFNILSVLKYGHEVPYVLLNIKIRFLPYKPLRQTKHEVACFLHGIILTLFNSIFTCSPFARGNYCNRLYTYISSCNSNPSPTKNCKTKQNKEQ